MSFANLNKESLWDIMSKMSYVQLTEFCQTEQSVTEQCRNPSFWKWLFQGKNIDPMGTDMNNVESLRRRYREWSRVNHFILFNVKPVQNEREFYTHDFLLTDGSCANVIADVMNRRLPRGPGLRWDGDAFMKSASEDDIRMFGSFNKVPAFTLPMDRGDIEIFSDVTYWVIVVASSTNIYARIINTAVGDEAQEMLESLELSSEIVNAIEPAIDSGEVDLDNSLLASRMRELGGPVFDEAALEDYWEFADNLAEFLIQPEQWPLWTRGFGIYDHVFQAACFTLQE